MSGKNIIRLFSKDETCSWLFPILFEDEHYIALDKMSHMSVSHSQLHPERPSLSELIRNSIENKARWITKKNINYLGFAYRLDFETSGISLFCKSNEARVAIGDLLGSNQEYREFDCLVHGSPKDDVFNVDSKIGWVAGQPEIMKAGKRGKFARTKFEVIERFAGMTMLRCIPDTDRKHQIRAHLNYVRLSPVGDSSYGGKLLMLSRLKKNYRPRRDGREKPLLDRTSLHYKKLQFDHPFSKEKVTIESELPKDMCVALKYLRKYASGLGLEN